MAKANRPRPIRILFIGNSFTQRNDLPSLIGDLAAACGIAVEHDLISKGGASLRAHWNSGQAAEAIKTGKYDYVVLQEQSTLPVKNANRMAENVRVFDEVIQQAGAKTVLYMTWARQHSPDTQDAITKAYSSVGKELGAVVVPVGRVWQSFTAKHQTPVLYDRDQSHPALVGSYLAACCFLVALWQQSPVGLEAHEINLNRKELAALQKAAWKFCAH